MGQGPSSLGSKGGRVRRSLRGFGRRSRVSKSGLSYTFSMVPGEPPELMDVNVATEEQLMTLPGVTRQLARDIVKHRRLIGRFKRVDDLALVSGKYEILLKNLTLEYLNRDHLSKYLT